MKPTGKKEVIEADMVMLAMGFLKTEHPKYAENVFIAGDAAMGASLVVKAMADARKIAAQIDSTIIIIIQSITAKNINNKDITSLMCALSHEQLQFY